MRSILTADFYKLIRSKAFWICAAVGIVVAILMVVALNADIARSLARGANSRGYAQAQAMQAAASAVWAIPQFLSQSFIVLLAGIFSAIFITAEFSDGTIKNTLSRGAERISVFASKFVTCTVASLFIFITSIAALLVAGSIVWGFDPQGAATAGGFAGMIALQALLMVGFAALFTFLGETIRSTGGAIATAIIATMMVSTLLGALNALFNTTIDLTQYWLGGAVSTLATTSPAASDVVRGVVVAVVWGVVSLVLGGWLFRKRDVK
ncbi:MAG: ABC transporter permease [Propionibacteriaceae bacterium]|nr:ABC transporter permease [Propionibacteriaceae bacterium]